MKSSTGFMRNEPKRLESVGERKTEMPLYRKREFAKRYCWLIW
jgi:hypothetical protein